MKKHIFLTGESGVGKSTILKRVIAALNIKTTGFVTLPYYIEGTKQGFYLSSLVEVQNYANNTPISVQVGAKKCVGIRETFETLGVESLEESCRGDQIILMDELGRLEREAIEFQNQVMNCLDCGQRVLGVIKLCQEPWLENIKKREDVLILEVTKDNREDIFAKVLVELERMVL
ncbi:MAG: nucleoside-triphosphatase [Cellulosilyticaceae bacterium]